jgi:hypothetical protein
MSVSSVSSTSAPLPFNYLDTNNNAQVAPAATADSSNDSTDATASQPPAPPPLPPGQGTRVNQLV